LKYYLRKQTTVTQTPEQDKNPYDKLGGHMAKHKISHAEIAIIVVAVIVLGLFANYGFQGPTAITGAISGKANVTIQSFLSINFITNQDTVTFGSGRVEGNCTNATLATDDASQDPTNCWTGSYPYNDTNNTFEIENDGNRIANVTVNGTNASTFIGGGNVTDPEFQFKGAESESNSCLLGNLETTYTNITATPVKLCERLFPIQPRDQLYTHIRVVIPEDASTGTHNATVEFTATIAS
jgi:hypothetical protein